MKYFRFVCGFKTELSGNLKIIHDSTMDEVSLYCAYLSRMYEFYFPATRTDNVISITVCLIDSSHSQELELYESCVSMETVYNVIDLNKFAILTPEDKSLYIIELCQQSIMTLVHNMHWNAESFESTYDKIKSTNGLFREHWKKAKVSPDKQLKAQIYFEDDYERNGTYVDFTDKKGKLIKRVQFTPSGYSVYCQDIGAIQWHDNLHVKIFYIYVPRAGNDYLQNMRDYWLIGVNGTMDFHYPRVEGSEINPHGLFNLGMLYWKGTAIMQDKEKGFALIKKSADLNYKHAQKWIEQNNK